jgi:hypothetical protein
MTHLGLIFYLVCAKHLRFIINYWIICWKDYPFLIESYLSEWRRLKKGTIECVTYKQKNLFLTVLRNSRSRCLVRSRVWWGPASWCADGYLLARTSHGGKSEKALWDSFIRTQRFSLPPNTIVLGVTISAHEFWGDTNIQPTTNCCVLLLLKSSEYVCVDILLDPLFCSNVIFVCYVNTKFLDYITIK